MDTFSRYQKVIFKKNTSTNSDAHNARTLVPTKTHACKLYLYECHQETGLVGFRN